MFVNNIISDVTAKFGIVIKEGLSQTGKRMMISDDTN